MQSRDALTVTAAEDPQERQKYIVLIIVGLLYSLGIAYLFAHLPGQELTDDFYPRWYASRMLLTTGRSLYDWANSVEVAGNWPFLHQVGYYYPAYLLLFTAPLSMMPATAARMVWTASGLWCLWLGVFIFARWLKPALPVNRLTWLLVLITTAVPVLQHTLNAQFNAIGVLALALIYRALSRQKYVLAGAWAGGLLFKPQAVLLPLFFFLMWSLFKKDRRGFWMGLALVSLALWGLAEIMESNWVMHFLQSLGRYEQTVSVVDTVWNPYQVVSLILMGVTVWLIFCFRHISAGATSFSGLLAWTISLNSLIVPLFGMLHIVVMGPVFVILLSGFARLYPCRTRWVWAGTMGLFAAGLLAFVVPLLLTGISGWQITLAEVVYKIAMPTLAGLASLPLIFGLNAYPELVREAP